MWKMIKSAIFLIFIFKHVKGNDTTCFQEETKLEGIKLELDGRYKYSFSVEKCQLLCEKTSNCTSWTFIGGNFPECLLFSEVQNVTEHDNATSGPKSCVQNKEKKPTLEKPSCILNETDIEGDQVGANLTSDSWFRCKKKCKKSDGCTFWTFFKEEKTCTLFTYVKEKRSNTGAVSGPKKCSRFKSTDNGKNATFLTRSGVSYLTTQNYPSDYGNNINTYWTLTAPAGKTIHFKFLDFELENDNYCYDYAKIVDSNGVELMPKRCGSSNPGSFSSQTNKAYVYFSSDYSVTKRGFKLEYKFDDPVWIEPMARTHWGYWGAVRVCSPGHNVVGAQLRIEPKQGWGDDTALNAIRFTCSNGMVLISAEQYWGDWRGYTKSRSNDFVGIRMRTEPKQGPGDDTAANGIQLKNSWGWIYYPSDGHFGDWSRWVYCPPGKKFIGFQTRVEPSRGVGDDTALNNVRILCG